MDEDNSAIHTTTWLRSVEPVKKDGFKEGATEGQVATFQSSFNVGYEQGLQFGLQIGFNHGYTSESNQEDSARLFQDTRRINCQLCINGTLLQEKIDNLYNRQEENNLKYLSERTQT